MPTKIKRRVGTAPSIEHAVDMVDMPGKCAFAGGYVNDGEKVCYFGVEYICRAPKLEKTGKSC